MVFGIVKLVVVLSRSHPDSVCTSQSSSVNLCMEKIRFFKVKFTQFTHARIGN